MTYKFKMNEGAEAEAKAKKLSSQNSGNMYVIAGTDKQRNETFIEVVASHLDSTIITGFTLARFNKGKRVFID